MINNLGYETVDNVTGKSAKESKECLKRGLTEDV